jgi:hypothetical protein
MSRDMLIFCDLRVLGSLTGGHTRSVSVSCHFFCSCVGIDGT